MTEPKQSRRKLFDPKSDKPYELSRSKLELLMQCPRCFYLDRRLGIKRPSGAPYTLNTAVDTLLKKEFDIHRAVGSRHPLFDAYGIDAIPFEHDKLDEWRNNFKGVRFLHRETNLLIFGAVDDIWVRPPQRLIVVDYKATGKEETVTALDSKWHDSYKRQMEIYQRLLRWNGFEVDDRGYFVYCTGKSDRAAFDARVEFDVVVIPYVGDDAWVEPLLRKARRVLMATRPPVATKGCEHCRYVAQASTV
ncbi:MAG: PD-(D/E)XK nuclease family protein [Patescibacteria group bacterium]|nr:PD-(D/E)XK nuclease family protein [Patescibacteria group bacterium]